MKEKHGICYCVTEVVVSFRRCSSISQTQQSWCGFARNQSAYKNKSIPEVVCESVLAPQTFTGNNLSLCDSRKPSTNSVDMHFPNAICAIPVPIWLCFTYCDFTVDYWTDCWVSFSWQWSPFEMSMYMMHEPVIMAVQRACEIVGWYNAAPETVITERKLSQLLGTSWDSGMSNVLTMMVWGQNTGQWSEILILIAPKTTVSVSKLVK